MSIRDWLSRRSLPQNAVAPSPFLAAPDEARSARLRGVVVRDDDVLDDYPDAVAQSFRKLEWPLNGHSGEQNLSVFSVRNAIVTRCYLSIDPSRGRLFANQSYQDVQVLWPLGHLLRENGFVFEADDIESIAGRTIVIGGPIDHNYYHWMLNWVQRLFVLERIAPSTRHDPRTRFLVDHRAQREPFASFLRLIGLPADRIIWSDHNRNYRLEEAVLVSFVSQNAYYPELLTTMVARLRDGMGWQAGKTRRRIFIDRQKLEAPKRRVENMDEIAPLLDELGFERIVLEDLPLEEQIRAFSDAEVVVGVHGAGLANLIFCRQDCRIVLIEKPFNTAIGLARTFSVLAEACGLAHELLIADGHAVEGTDYTSFYNCHHQDVWIDRETLTEALRRACAGTDRPPLKSPKA